MQITCEMQASVIVFKALKNLMFNFCKGQRAKLLGALWMFSPSTLTVFKPKHIP